MYSFFMKGTPLTFITLLLACFGQDPIYTLENNNAEPILMISIQMGGLIATTKGCTFAGIAVFQNPSHICFHCFRRMILNRFA